MPEISRFLGIVIYMYFNDHNPPHFHVKFGNHRAEIDIETQEVLAGSLPKKTLSLVVKWAKIHKSELRKNWQDLAKKGEFNKIKPLD